MAQRLITFIGETAIARLVEAGLGTLARASTPFGQLPAVAVSEEVWAAYQTWCSGRYDTHDGSALVAYLLERFR